MLDPLEDPAKGVTWERADWNLVQICHVTQESSNNAAQELDMADSQDTECDRVACVHVLCICSSRPPYSLIFFAQIRGDTADFLAMAKEKNCTSAAGFNMDSSAAWVFPSSGQVPSLLLGSSGTSSTMRSVLRFFLCFFFPPEYPSSAPCGVSTSFVSVLLMLPEVLGLRTIRRR
jgi:hypothetical protein